jgi:molecular chaperone GrpE
MPKISKKEQELQTRIEELTQDLQRLQADFENYRKRMDNERISLTELTKAATILKLLPVVDDIERAVSHVPEDLSENTWAQGVTGLARNVHKSLHELGLVKVNAEPGTPFDPDVHEAVVMEEGEGEQEVIAEELRPGYKLGEQLIRPAMVKVTHG